MRVRRARSFRPLRPPAFALLCLAAAAAIVTAPARAQPQQPSAQPGAPATAEQPAAPRSTIALTPEPGQDEAITERLGEIYAAMSGLGGVEVATQAGVVRLSGGAEAPRFAAAAEEIARALEGVVAVENEIEAAPAVQRRVRGVFADLRERALRWLRALPLWAIAAALVIGAWYAGAWLGRVAVRGLRDARNPYVGQLVRQAVRIAAAVAGVLVALLLLDVGPALGTIVGGLGLIGLAIGFAVRDTIENYFASILLSLRQPFSPDELVSVDGREGRVLRLNSRATLLMDIDGNHVRIPNALVYKATIVNYDRNPFRRFSFRAGVDPAAPLPRVLRLAERALSATPGVLADPAPLALTDAFGDWATEIVCSAWIDQRSVDLFKTRGAAMAAVQSAFARAGIEMPVPRYSLVPQGPAAAEESGATAEPGPPPEVEPLDVSPDDPTRPFRERDSGQNLLAEHGRAE